MRSGLRGSKADPESVKRRFPIPGRAFLPKVFRDAISVPLSGSDVFRLLMVWAQFRLPTSGNGHGVSFLTSVPMATLGLSDFFQHQTFGIFHQNPLPPFSKILFHSDFCLLISYILPVPDTRQNQFIPAYECEFPPKNMDVFSYFRKNASAVESIFQFLGRRRNLIILFVLFLMFNVGLGWMMPKEHALDLKFAYSASEAYAALEDMGPAQRESYKIGIVSLDMPYIPVYCLLFSGLLVRVWKRRAAAWLPLAIAVMDLLENLSVLVLLALFPAKNETMGLAASFFSTSKWALIALLAIALVFGLISTVVFRRHPPSKNKEEGI